MAAHRSALQFWTLVSHHLTGFTGNGNGGVGVTQSTEGLPCVGHLACCSLANPAPENTQWGGGSSSRATGTEPTLLPKGSQSHCLLNPIRCRHTTSSRGGGNVLKLDRDDGCTGL